MSFLGERGNYLQNSYCKSDLPAVIFQLMRTSLTGNNNPGGSSPQQEILVGRQPIFDRYQNVIGYELLFRSASVNISSIDGDLATTQVILNTFSEIGLANLVGEGVAFINCTRSFLTGQLPFPLPPDKAIIEVLEDITIDKQLVNSLIAMSRKGYNIALDDVVSFERVRPLLGLARIAKIDLPKVPVADLAWMVSKFKENGVRVLAEKVETLEEFDYCRKVGFDYFQGYFLCRPNIVKGKRIDSARMVILHAMAVLQNPNMTFQMLEDVLSRDVTLTYKLLKLANSAHYSQRNQINSLSQTISILGITQLSGWLTLMLVSSVDNKPHELTAIAMIRGKLCEILGKKVGEKDTNTLFMVGLFSVLDALFDRPMAEILESLPIADDVAKALLRFEGRAGQIFQSVLAMEQGQTNSGSLLNLSTDILSKANIEAINWTTELIRTSESTLKAM